MNKFLFFFIIVFANIPESALATKPCNNIDFCETTGKFDPKSCAQKADIILTGQIQTLQTIPPENLEDHFKIKIEKFEKGDTSILKSSDFQTGCYVSTDLSVLMGDNNKSHKRFRFYLLKSSEEVSGYKVIHYESLETN